MNILITGGAGLVGSHTADQLIKSGHNVVIVDNLITGFKKFINSKAIFYELNITDKNINAIFIKHKIDMVFHLAAQWQVRKSTDNPLFDAETNILGSINIFESAKKNNVKKIIFSSSGGVVYGESETIPTPEDSPCLPLCPYGVAKLACEKYLYYYHAIHKLPYTILRYGNIYGPRQNPHGEAGIVAILINKIQNHLPPTINGDGEQTRDYVYVDDIVEANILAMKSEKNDIYNIGTGKETTVNELYASIAKMFPGNTIRPLSQPAKQGEQIRSCIQNTKAKHELNWFPKVGLETGLQRSWDWYNQNKA